MSPDGRWVAYQSDESGSYEVYLQAYPTPGLKTLVSAGGGVNPVWRGDGRESLLLEGSPVARREHRCARPGRGAGGARTHAPARRSVRRKHWRGYDASPDGKRFAIVTARNSTSRLVVALHALNAGAARAWRP